MTETKEFTTNLIPPLTATILNTETVSDAVPLFGTTALAFETPAALDGTVFTFLGSIDDAVTFKTIKDSSDIAVTFTVAPDGSYPMSANTFAPYDYIKIVSGTTETGDRLIKIKPYSV